MKILPINERKRLLWFKKWVDGYPKIFKNKPYSYWVGNRIKFSPRFVATLASCKLSLKLVK